MKNHWSALVILTSLLAGCAHTPKRGATGPFDEAADARSQVTNAIAEARQLNRNVLLIFGANWCSDSRATIKLFETNAAIAKRLNSSFVVVTIDVGSEGETRNADLVEQYHAATYEGIPVLVILDHSGKPLNDTRLDRLTDDVYQRPERISEFLDNYSPAQKESP